MDRTWKCTHCSEAVENSLDVCWNCGTSRDGVRDPDFKSADEICLTGTTQSAAFELWQQEPERHSGAAPSVKLNKKGLIAAFVIVLCFVSGVAWFSGPKSALDFYNLGKFHLRRQEYAQAIQAMTRSLELLDQEDKPFSPREIYAARGVAYNNLGEFENSVRDISRAIDLIPTSKDGISQILSTYLRSPSEEAFDNLYLVRANALIGLGKTELAKADLKYLLQKNSDNSHARDLLTFIQQREADQPSHAKR